MAKILGRADVVADGTTLLSDDSSTIDLGGFSRPAVVGNKVHGYREEVKEAKVEVNVSIDANFSAAAIQNLVGVTINFIADTGQTWVVRDAWCAEPITIAQKDGKAKVVFMGQPAEEITAA